jgi:hypothetical protein
MQNAQTIRHADASARHWPAWPLKALMTVLFFGPLAAPLFQATRAPFVADTGALARDLLSLYICPTPAKSYMLLGFPMGVCARCWGATIGLWVAWFVFRGTTDHRRRYSDASLFGRWSLVVGRLPSYTHLSWVLRLVISALPFLLWALEINLWATAPYWVLLLNGALAGFCAGLFFCSIWPAAHRA